MLTTLCLAAAVFSACGAVRRCLCRRRRNRELSLWRGRICLTELWNGGAAFGLPVSRGAVSAAALAMLPAALLRWQDSPAGTGLLLGGGLSNLWERLRHGRVFDYIRFPKAPGRLGRYVFNLADFAVFLGTAGLLLGQWRRLRR